MNKLVTIAIRVLFTFVAFMVIQYKIPYFFLAPGGLVAGFFMYKTSSDRELSIGVMIGSVLFGLYALAMHYLGFSKM
jgi:NO-binding membrane sensor protein with MHYT domain